MKNSTYLMSDNPIFSPNILEMVNQTIELMKLDIVQGLAYEEESKTYHKKGIKKNPSKLGNIVANHLRNLSPNSKFKRSDYSKELPINKLYNSEIRTLSRRHNVDLVSTKSIMQQQELAKNFKYISYDIKNPTQLVNMHENLFDTQINIHKIASSPTASLKAAISHLNLDAGVARIFADRLKHETPDVAVDDNHNDNGSPDETTLNKGLKFKLHRIKCVDETNPEWPGDDEIALGGIAVDPNEVSTKINEFRVGNSFDDGESKNYSPPRILKNYNIDGLSYPADFLVILALAEKDSGGMSEFIHELWESVKDEVTLIITAVGVAAGAAAGAAIGGSTGTAIGGPLGTIIGLAAGAIIGALIGWLISALNDDIFEPKSAALELPVHNATFENGSLTSSIMTLNFRDHGGHYRAYYSWQITR